MRGSAVKAPKVFFLLVDRGRENSDWKLGTVRNEFLVFRAKKIKLESRNSKIAITVIISVFLVVGSYCVSHILTPLKVFSSATWLLAVLSPFQFLFLARS